MWIQRFIETARGTFKIFEKGEGEPLTVTHLYNEFETGKCVRESIYEPFLVSNVYKESI